MAETYPPRDGTPPPDGRVLHPKPPSGQRVIITRLMYRMNMIPEPNYTVAAAIGIAPITLSYYARGVKPIQAHHLIRLCEFFQCEPEEIMGDIEVEVK